MHRPFRADQRHGRGNPRSPRPAPGRPGAGGCRRGHRRPRPARATGRRRPRAAPSRAGAARQRGRPPRRRSTTSSSSSSSRSTAASAASSSGARRTTSSSTAAGSRSGESRLLVRASCSARARDAALGLEQLASLERSACRDGEVAGQLEVVVRETALLGEEDEYERGLVAPRRLHGRSQQRAAARLVERAAPFLVEALVGAQARRREHAPAPGGRAQRSVRIAQPVLEEAHERGRQRVEAGKPAGRRGAASGRPRSSRRAPRPPPARARRASPRATPAPRAPRRSGRSRAARGPGASAPRSSRRSAARVPRGSRRPPGARPRRGSAAGRAHACRPRGRP